MSTIRRAPEQAETRSRKHLLWLLASCRTAPEPQPAPLSLPVLRPHSASRASASAGPSSRRRSRAQALERRGTFQNEEVSRS